MPYGGGAGGGSVTGGVIHTDPAVGPAENVGELGDFHLKEDTGTLTGPKKLGTNSHRSTSTAPPYTLAATTNKPRGAAKFVPDTALVIDTLSLAFEDNSAAGSVTLFVLDEFFNIIEQTSQVAITVGQFSQASLLNPVSLDQGTVYMIAYIATSTLVDPATAGTIDFPDSISPTTGVRNLFWNTIASDFTDPPDNSFSGDFLVFSVETAVSPTWVGANSYSLTPA